MRRASTFGLRSFVAVRPRSAWAATVPALSARRHAKPPQDVAHAASEAAGLTPATKVDASAPVEDSAKAAPPQPRAEGTEQSPASAAAETEAAPGDGAAKGPEKPGLTQSVAELSSQIKEKAAAAAHVARQRVEALLFYAACVVCVLGAGYWLLAAARRTERMCERQTAANRKELLAMEDELRSVVGRWQEENVARDDEMRRVLVENGELSRAIDRLTGMLRQCDAPEKQ